MGKYGYGILMVEYKLNLPEKLLIMAIDINESDDLFITNFTGTSGNSYDGDYLVPLVDEKIANSSKPEKIGGDTHYGSAENRNQMSTMGITLVAPFRDELNPTGLFTQEEFYHR